MMKLNGEDANSRITKADVFEIAIDVLAFLFGSVLVVYLMLHSLGVGQDSKVDSKTEVVAYVDEVYRIKSDSGDYSYYMKLDTDNHGYFDVEISKSDFMKYKVNDPVHLVIQGDRIEVVEKFSY